MQPAHMQSRPSSQQSLSMSQQSQQNAGNPSLYRQFTDPGRQHVADDVMPIYSATYSGVNVYEMEVNNVTVMRRQNDSWLNATQILKVAGVDKGRRTKILEKEIQTGTHEKVQGGYGKYQGTWIPFERGLEVCRLYGVEDMLNKLLTHNMRADGQGFSADVDTPTKEQAMAAQRKRLYNAAAEARANTNGNNGTFFKSISAMASHAVAAISKARFDSPGPRNRNGPSRAPSFNRQASMQSVDDFPGNSQQSFVSDYGQNMEPAYSTQGSQQMNGDEPPRKRPRMGMPPNDSFGYPQSMSMYADAFPGSPTEPNDSFIYSQRDVHAGAPTEGSGPLRPLPFEVSPDAESKRSMLMSLFMDATTNDSSKQEMLQSLTPLELDMPIDSQSHTALHWAATLSRMPLLRALISSGANPFRVNASGETPLMRACVVTNSMDNNSFPELLDVLGGTIDVKDDKGRTVLHHIAVTSAVKGRNHASRYYLESLLEWVVKQGSAPSSQPQQGQSGVNGNIASNAPAKMGLGRFMSEIVNAQDRSGDTALNIAARIGNRSIISQLLEVGADPNIANHAGLRPADFGISAEPTEGRANGDANSTEKDAAAGSSQKSRESSDDVVNSITHLLTETSGLFQGELRTKQQSIDSLHASLRTTSTQVGEARRSLDSLQEKVREQQLARQKVTNLKQACEEEEYRVLQLEQSSGHLDVASAVQWENELEVAVEAARNGTGPTPLSSAAALRARINAVRARSNETRRAVSGLKSRSRDVELKYRHLVSLCTRQPDGEVDTLLDGLTRAVESEKGELEITRVRKFLGGVESVA